MMMQHEVMQEVLKEVEQQGRARNKLFTNPVT